MSKKFSQLLMAGKAATLPFLMNNAQAVQTWTPNMYSVISDQVTQVQVPVSQAVELVSLGTSPTYDGAATLCTVNGSVTSKLGVVLTGLVNSDRVYVVTSTSLGGNQMFHPNLKIGTQKLLVPKFLNISADGAESVSATVGIELATLAAQGYPLSSGTSFYMQTIVLPLAAYQSGSIDWSKARISELDVVSVKTCTQSSPYSTY